MAYRAAQSNFTRGEVAPEIEARFDVQSYSSGLRLARNVRVRKTGGISKRMGTRYVADALGQDSAVRLFPFQFSDDQGYALEFGQAYMRPAAYGGMVLEEGLLVTAITNAASAQITIAYHGLSVGDPVWLTGIAGMTELNGRFLEVTEVVNADNFKVNFDSTNAGTFTGSGGGTSRVGSPPTPPPAPTVPPVTPTTLPPEIGGGSGGGYDDDGNWKPNLTVFQEP
jgi:hypothetical protein